MATDTAVQNLSTRDLAPVTVFRWGAYMVDLSRVISVQPNPVKGQVAIQMPDGAYTVWHAVPDPIGAAMALTDAKCALPNVQVVRYEDGQ